LRATIQFLPQIPQRAVAVAGDVLAHRFILRITEDREQVQPVQEVFQEDQATPQAPHRHKVTTGATVMVQAIGKAVAAAVQDRLV
jgi:hypothetical protein